MTDERRAPTQGSGRWWLPAWHPKRGDAQSPGTIAWAEHEAAWREYARRYGESQSAERIAERGGFGHEELRMLLGHEPRTLR